MHFMLATQTPINMPAPLGFDSWLTFWMCIAIATINAVAMCFAGYRFLQVLQLSGYRMKGYFAWIRDTKGKFWGGLIMLSLLSSAALLITNVLLSDFFKYKIMTYFGLIFYFIFLIVYIININSLPMKTPLKYTHRLNRLMGVMFVLVYLITFFLTAFSTIYVPYFRYGSVALIPALLPIIIILSHYIVLPFEILNNNTNFLLFIFVFNSLAILLNIESGKNFSTLINNICKRKILVIMYNTIKQHGASQFDAI